MPQPVPLKPLPLDTLGLAIRDALTPDLLKPEWRRKNEQSGAHPLTGHCYVATEAYYHLRGKAAGFVPRVLSGDFGTHWWLQNPAGEIIDLTAEQFPNGVDYSKGRGSGFLTREPSKRAQIVIERVGEVQVEKVETTRRR